MSEELRPSCRARASLNVVVVVVGMMMLLLLWVMIMTMLLFLLLFWRFEGLDGCLGGKDRARAGEVNCGDYNSGLL